MLMLKGKCGSCGQVRIAPTNMIADENGNDLAPEQIKFLTGPCSKCGTLVRCDERAWMPVVGIEPSPGGKEAS